ncbi:MAG: glucokinase, partial [Bdellovibrionales bacterium]|nr:glucokinase [Bdellovibrionales bacterium]
HQAFAESFRTSPTHQALLSAIPVYLMDNQESGLWGAAYCGSQELNRT